MVVYFLVKFKDFFQEKAKKSFFDEVPEKTDDSKDETTFGEKHISKQSWGEQMTKTTSPGIVLVDFENESIKKGLFPKIIGQINLRFPKTFRFFR